MARNNSELSVMKEEIVEVIFFFANRKHIFLVQLKAECTFPVDSVAVLNDCFNMFDFSPLMWKVQLIYFASQTR